MFEVAAFLRIPLYRLEEEMPYDELKMWFAYFEKRPQGWREDDRAAKIIQAQGVKEKAWNLFPSLDRIYNPGKFTENAVDSLKGSYLFHKMLSAKGGDKLDL
jgi:hypothetical protein